MALSQSGRMASDSGSSSAGSWLIQSGTSVIVSSVVAGGSSAAASWGMALNQFGRAVSDSGSSADASWLNQSGLSGSDTGDSSGSSSFIKSDWSAGIATASSWLAKSVIQSGMLLVSLSARSSASVMTGAATKKSDRGELVSGSGSDERSFNQSGNWVSAAGGLVGSGVAVGVAAANGPVKSLNQSGIASLLDGWAWGGVSGDVDRSANQSGKFVWVFSGAEGETSLVRSPNQSGKSAD